MKLNTLKGYTGKILSYCEDRDFCYSMLDALDEDLSVDRYQDTQPGGGNLVEQNRSSYELYSDRLAGLTSESVFGELYQKADSDERILFDRLLETFDKNYSSGVYVEEINPAYQMADFLKCVCDFEFAEKQFSPEDIQLLSEGGSYFLNLVKYSYDEDKDEFLFRPDGETAKGFLKEKGVIKENEKESIDSKIAAAEKRCVSHSVSGHIQEKEVERI